MSRRATQQVRDYMHVVIQVRSKKTIPCAGTPGLRSARPRSPELTMQEDFDTPARKHNLAHDLVARLTQSILLGQMLPGDKLPSENSIVQEHGVSRTVVREAISKLQASGLVETRHGIGTFVIERAPEQG